MSRSRRRQHSSWFPSRWGVEATALDKTSVISGRGASGMTEEEREALFRFLFACYLLQADGRHYIAYWANPFVWTQARIDYMKTNASALGAPMGAYTVESGTTKILRRAFQGGYVRVNKSNSLTQGSPALGPRAHETVLS